VFCRLDDLMIFITDFCWAKTAEATISNKRDNRYLITGQNYFFV